MQKAWEALEKIAPAASRTRSSLNCFFAEQFQKHPEWRLKAYLQSRSLLGRMCLTDHRSAAKQSGKTITVTPWKDAFPEHVFQPRPERLFPQNSSIERLRHTLKECFLETIHQHNRTFYFIDAPTGLGKTEAMLCAAEYLRAHTQEPGQFRKIVFAVPQVSVADQVFEDYFPPGCDAQIWNYRRRERSVSAETPSTNGSDAEALEAEQHPFQCSYNVTTFNQVLLAMCHPNRNRCIRGLGLQDAVIILDEFHKLPQVILPFFFRLAREYGSFHHCKFILGSATPLEPLKFWDLQDSLRIPEEKTKPLYQAPEINNRRIYHSLGRLSVAQLKARIEEIHDSGNQNLLVVVNLIEQGSWPLRRLFGQPFQPWQQLKELQTPGSGRIIVWLDGLVPPGLRRDLITAAREAMKHRPLTLISTQMIEVGVDLDFDTALIDYQGIAATIQRGGRVGRNGRAEPCHVGVFELEDNESNSSWSRILAVRERDPRWIISAFESVKG